MIVEHRTSAAKELTRREGPLLTIVVTCYSGAPFFDETVSSLVNQTDNSSRIVFHDNGCSTAYRRRLNATARRIGAEVITSEINRYGESLRFDVLDQITTKYMAIIHDDDFYYPNKVASGLAVMERKSLDFLFTDRQLVDQDGRAQNDFEGVNVDPVVPEDYPTAFLAELFYKGLRIHFSTMIIKTSLALKTRLGDPYLPRIADTLFFSRLLLDRKLNGIVLPERLTAVRIHGNNDFLYSKFSGERQQRELYQLSIAEQFVFQEIVRGLSDDDLAKFFNHFPGTPLEDTDTRTRMLVKAALWFRPWKRSKKLMATYCMHEAFQLDPVSAMSLVRHITGDSDANAEMIKLYDDFVGDEIALFSGAVDYSDRFRNILRQVLNSRSWRWTAPLRALTRAVTGSDLVEDHALADYRSFYPVYPMGAELMMSSEDVAPYILSGFAQGESWGRWTDGKTARLRLLHPAGLASAKLKLDIHLVFSPIGEAKPIAVTINAGQPHRFEVSGGQVLTIETGPGELSRSGECDIELTIFSPKAKLDEPIEDTRQLGLGLKSICLTANP